MATLNVNVGVLGHVDSGKTSLGEVSGLRAAPCQAAAAPQPPLACPCCRRPPPVRAPPPVHAPMLDRLPAPPCPARAAPRPVAALSTTLSTAALDKHPQSRERGITLDLGFSALTVSLRRAAAAWVVVLV